MNNNPWGNWEEEKKRAFAEMDRDLAAANRERKIMEARKNWSESQKRIARSKGWKLPDED